MGTAAKMAGWVARAWLALAAPAPALIKVEFPPELAGTVAPGGPVVLFVRGTSGEPLGIVHLAGVWLMAQAMPGRGLGAWRVTGPYDGGRERRPPRGRDRGNRPRLPLPFAVTTRTRAAAGDARGLKPRQNLLLLAEDGRLFEMVNTAN